MSIVRPTPTEVHHFGGGYGAFASRGAVYSGSTTVPFTAASQANCILALRADLGIAVTGSNVTLWADQSGNGNDATASANHPQYTAGNNYVGFAAASTQSFLCNGIANALNNTDQACSVFAIAYRTDSLATRALMGVGRSTMYGLRVEGVSTQRLRAGRNDGTTVVTANSANSTFSDATWELMGVIVPGTTANMYTDTTGSPSTSAAAFDTGTITNGTATTNGRIGAASNTTTAIEHWDGRIAALCVYTANHTGATASAIVANLTAWGQSVGLL